MKQTPLHDEHVALGARMVEFAGWRMPIQYQGIQQEHRAVREGAGMFDVSHMGTLRVRGPQTVAFLRWATLNNPERLRDGQGQYTLLANAQGGLIDDLYVYRVSEEDHVVVANAANVDAVAAHLRDLAGQDPGPFTVTIADESAEGALIAVQGPTVVSKLAPLVRGDLENVRKNRFLDALFVGMPVRFARTGYTGEDGFEIFCRADLAVRVWRALLAAHVVPCGLGARDTLRLEAGFPLYGHEFGPHTNPLCTPFAWVVKDKPAFGLAAIRAASCARQLVGLMVDGRGIPREGYRVLDAAGGEIGVVTSGSSSPWTRRGIAFAWVDAAHASLGAAVTIEIRGQPVAATVSPTPFFERSAQVR
jgi:aminomethyltransferase